MNCPTCDSEVLESAAFCHHCGAPLRGGSDTPTPRQQFMQAATSTQDDDDEPERELWQGTFSKLAMIGAWLGAGVFTLVMVIAGIVSGFGGRGWLIAVALICLVWAVLVVRLIYLQLSQHYYLSNQRFVHEKGLLWREINRVEAIDIDDVTFVQGPVERFLGVGTVKIISSDQSHPVIDMQGIENVRAVASLIDETRRQERRKRGLHIESI